ncbi:MAG: rhodanese-like domain-containing protein [Clostridiaceae bacterium]|nr:rhodanese-like domain-containing protein [Clostridiaceae bacterium]
MYRIIGCATGTCPLTSNPYISTIYGIILGILIAGIFTTPRKQSVPENDSTPGRIMYKRITAKEAKARIDSGDNVIILDVRTKEEYDQEHIPGSILIPNETISDTKPELLPDTDAEILIYCRSGNRSAQAARKLIALGYTNVYDFGGIIDWPYDKATTN